MLVSIVVFVFVLVVVAALVVDWRERRATVSNLHQERLRIQHEQFLAERRLQGMTQQTLQRLLDESRTANDRQPSDAEWYRP